MRPSKNGQIFTQSPIPSFWMNPDSSMKKTISKKSTPADRTTKFAWLWRIVPSHKVKALVAALLTAIVGYACHLIEPSESRRDTNGGEFACFVSCVVLDERGGWAPVTKQFAVTAKNRKDAAQQAEARLTEEAKKRGLVLPFTVSVLVVPN
jgi:hypothetical protein